MMVKEEALLVITTCPDTVSAKQIAQQLVANKLAACVNVLPQVASYFNWGGNLEVAEEILLFIKTNEVQYTELENKIMQLHPYEVPEIIAIPLNKGLKKYMAWIHKSLEA